MGAELAPLPLGSRVVTNIFKADSPQCSTKTVGSPCVLRGKFNGVALLKWIVSGL